MLGHERPHSWVRFDLVRVVYTCLLMDSGCVCMSTVCPLLMSRAEARCCYERLYPKEKEVLKFLFFLAIF